jgi:hypothetical protein
MEETLAIQLAAKEIELSLHTQDAALWMEQLVEKINNLITADFSKLINILYRMDVSETKLKQLLKDKPAEDAARIIAELMIERQTEKIKSRQQFNQRDNNNIDENEKW